MVLARKLMSVRHCSDVDKVNLQKAYDKHRRAKAILAKLPQIHTRNYSFNVTDRDSFMVFNSLTPSEAARFSDARNRQSNYLNTILGTPTDMLKSVGSKKRLNYV